MTLDNKITDGSAETKILPVLIECDIRGRKSLPVFIGFNGTSLAGEICVDIEEKCKGINMNCPYFEELNCKYFEELSKE